ncbi:MAG TPA: N-methyl-L-tryptophan oxidase [Chloroflexota bacterium]|jgi:sarcosine oxidase|nr:N-methyl-L-tryptophan oxidase [Chloroflexota bacterium]
MRPESGYDAIVVGLGAMGSAAAYHLARRGHRVLGLDAHERGHALGSSHGRSRIIREAYYEAPEYVPLVRRAYALWRELEAEAGRALLRITGGLTVGPGESELVAGALASARRHDLPYERLTAADVNARFPGFRLTEDLVAVFEPNAGILAPEACVGAHLDLAARHGAVLRHGEGVRGWAADGGGVRVETEAASYAAERLVITAGPWASEVLGDLRLPLAVQRVVNVHFEPIDPEPFGADRCPVYLWLVPEGQYYGFPALPGQGVKFGRHDAGEVCTPRTIRRQVDPAEVEALRAVLNRYMPGAGGAVKWTLTCMYTNTPDRHFVIDRHPGQANVAIGCGFSGHGFKFASAVGEVLADLAAGREPRHSIAFLSSGRFGEEGAVVGRADA